MTDSTTLPTPSSWRKSPAVLAFGAVLLASLGAVAGWMIRSEAPAPAAAPATAQQTALLSPTSAGKVPDDEVAAPPRDAGPEQAAAPAAAKVQAKPAPVQSARTAPKSTQGSGAQAAVCRQCGRVESVAEVHRKGEATGLGAVTGGVLGGLVGSQMGKGNGKTAMTAIGAVGGGIAGHEVEKRARGDVVYQVHVRMDDGSVKTVTTKTPPAAGARVAVEGQSLRAL